MNPKQMMAILSAFAATDQSHTGVIDNDPEVNSKHKVVSIQEKRMTKSRTNPNEFYTISLKLDNGQQGIGHQVTLFKKPTFQNTHPLPFEQIDDAVKRCAGDLAKAADLINQEGGVVGRWRTYQIEPYYLYDRDGNLMTNDDGKFRVGDIARVWLYAGEDDMAGRRLATSGRQFVNETVSGETGDLNNQVDNLTSKGSTVVTPPPPPNGPAPEYKL